MDLWTKKNSPIENNKYSKIELASLEEFFMSRLKAKINEIDCVWRKVKSSGQM